MLLSEPIHRVLPRFARIAAAVLAATPMLAVGQTATAPAGTDAPLTKPMTPAKDTTPALSQHDLHAADDAFLKGARALDRGDLSEAELDFARAVRLNPRNRDYSISLAVTREHRLTELVQRAARAREHGRPEEADQLLLQAREIDPNNAVVQQHFANDGRLAAAPLFTPDPIPGQAERVAEASGLAGAIQLVPSEGRHSFHLHATAPDLIREVCQAYGIHITFAAPLEPGPVLRFDLDNASWTEALRAVQLLTRTFAVPTQPQELLLAADTPENRAQYAPLIEETLYMPGTTQADLTEYAAMARTVFNLRVVNAVSSAGSLVLRGDEDTLSRVNATFADLVDGGAEVLLDLTLFEVDRSHIVALGAQLPSSIGVFPIAATAQSLISANQSVISQAIANNLITLTGNANADALTELEFLLASGTVNSSQFTNLLGVIGHYAGLPLAGVFLGSTTTLNASLNSSDVRLLDTMQLRLGDRQDGQFRAGTRYPIQTGIYSSALPSSLTNAAAGLSINGTSVSSLLSQYLGSSSVTVPQIQFEDLGLTLKATPQILRTGEVTVKLDFKVEALGSGSINTLPILNSRQLSSTVTIPRGQTALLASQVSNSELRAISGLPFLSEIPGFQSTYQSTEKDTTELMITLTPHIVRNRNLQVTSRRLFAANNGEQSSQ